MSLPDLRFHARACILMRAIQMKRLMPLQAHSLPPQ
jgi:hypothetical protein